MFDLRLDILGRRRHRKFVRDDMFFQALLVDGPVTTRMTREIRLGSAVSRVFHQAVAILKQFSTGFALFYGVELLELAQGTAAGNRLSARWGDVLQEALAPLVLV